MTAFVHAARVDSSINAGGDVAAVAVGYDHHSIQLYERPAGGPAATTTLASDPDVLVADPHVAFNDDGDLAVAWVDNANGGAAHVAIRPAGSSSFRAPIDVAADRFGGMNTEDDVRIAMDDAGEVAFAWATGTSSPAVHWMMIGVDGSTGTPDVATSTFSLGFSLSMNRAGDAVIALAKVNSTIAQDALQLAVRPAGGSFGAPVDVTTGLSDTEPATAINADGDAAVAYTEYVSGHREVRAATLPAGGAVGAPQNVSDAGRDTEYPSIALTGDGTTVVTWSGAFIDSFYTASAPPNGAFTPAMSFGLRSDSRSQVVLAPDGTGQVFMMGESGLYAAKRNADGTFAALVQVSTDALSDGSNEPGGVGGLDASGDAVVFWPGGAEQIKLAYLDVNPPQLSNVTVPATGTSGTELAFSATTSDALTSTSTFWDFGDGSGGAYHDAVTHTYARGGTYTVTVTTTDASGNAAPSQSRTIVVAQGPTPPATGGDTGTDTATRTDTATTTQQATTPATTPVVTRPAPAVTPAAVAVTCKVPSLTGLTVAAAKRKLVAAHCRLGTATTPKKYKKTKGLVIRTQSRKSGSKAAAGTKVGVTLGPRATKSKRK